jgi:hypothetical protein
MTASWFGSARSTEYKGAAGMAASEGELPSDRRVFNFDERSDVMASNA